MYSKEKDIYRRSCHETDHRHRLRRRPHRRCGVRSHRTLAGEALTIQEWNAEKLAQRLAFFARERDAEKFVLGLPKNMDGTEGPRAEKARQFKALLEEASGLPVILWDERRSTIEAHAILHAAGKKEKKHRANVDAVAATLLLEGYLASPNR